MLFSGVLTLCQSPLGNYISLPQQRWIAQPSPDSVGGAKGVLLHNSFYAESSTGNHSSGMSAKTGSRFSVYEILIRNGSPTIFMLETAITAREMVLF